MTQEQKDILLKDLCARLPYGVKVICETEKSIFEVEVITSYNCVCPKDKNYLHNIYDDEIKPCLFPLSSMTEDLKNELYTNLTELELKAINDEIEHSVVTTFEIDFYHKHHIDYRGLIPMGLAIDATGLNIY
jgi:hypothetical protein